jgi:formate C-acetyltransferase
MRRGDQKPRRRAITKEDAYDYSVIGCSEVAFGGRGTEGFAYQGLSGGRLLETMMSGKDPVSGVQRTSGVGDMLQWRTADDMMQAFRDQVRLFTRFMFSQLLPLVEAHTKHAPCPFLSSVTRDCISRGQSYYGGGAIYGNGVVNVCYVGIGSVGNSIAAIKKLVFDDQVLTMAQLKHALETDFEDGSTTPTGPEVRQLCLDAPKYGNDDPYVDNVTKDCLNILVKELRQYKTGIGGRYHATISPVSTHVIYGMACGATPDGRKAGAPLSDGCSPAQGTDVNGPTATIKSVANLEHINLAQGTIFNMKMHPAAFETKAGMMKWANLVRTYFDLGGWEIHFNVVDAETLKAAQETPEEYKDLVVRVVGYSAFFVELDKSVQDDIISRTEHTV